MEWGHGGGVSCHTSLVVHGEGGGDLHRRRGHWQEFHEFPPIYHTSSAVGVINWEDEGHSASPPTSFRIQN